ncbi:Variant surface glycoprotein [Trypanosoma congolense IL3000]|uniref:Variant surface glycoprotein n=1 Tax=Trypanosoma congolense (strain IL3000) TaxID=1068625 RepID=F9W813_TRYCI|nr:Variant surface glycoprotein [Trypanosoma congolense IL3000]
MVIRKFLLVTWLLCVGAGRQCPSSAEFNLFCKLLREANYVMHGPVYVYDEDKDKETLKVMQVLHNATTKNMKEFQKTLWDMKDIFQEHSLPTRPENWEKTHNEIGQLIMEGEKEVDKNRNLAKQVNEKIEAAKLLLAQGIYGDHVMELPKNDGNYMKVLENTSSIFNDENSASKSCGNTQEKAGKTLINDLFCVCVGDADDAQGPCHPNIWPPKSWGYTGSTGNWTQIKYGPDYPTLIPSFNESLHIMEQVCWENMTENNVKSENITALLEQYVSLIGKGNGGVKQNKNIFGHSTRSKNRGQVKECDGQQGNWHHNGPEKKNDKTCVDYTHNLQGKKYDIPWHNKFREAAEKMKEAKTIKVRILKKRAALLLLKTKVWAAYNREKDDETSNLDDVNLSNLLDGTQLPSFSPLLSYLSIFL